MKKVVESSATMLDEVEASTDIGVKTEEELAIA